MTIPKKMRYKTSNRDMIAFLPFGNVPSKYISFIRRITKVVFGMESVVLPKESIQSAHYDTDRGQADADALLRYLFDKLPQNCHRIIGVLEGDMYAAGRTFVFGYAHLRDGVGMVSLSRLKEEYYGRPEHPQLLRKRLYRCLVHEIGHTFSAAHCENYCIMHACSHVESLQELAPSFCAKCMNIVRSNQDISSTSSEGIFRRAGATLRRYRTEDAIELYKEASLKKPTDARFVNDLGVAQLSLGDNAEARKSFIRAIGLSASFPHPYYNLAILSKDNAEEADKYLNQGIKVDPDPTAAHLYVGKLYDQIFYNKKKAANHYQAYLDMGGNNPEVSSWLKDAR